MSLFLHIRDLTFRHHHKCMRIISFISKVLKNIQAETYIQIRSCNYTKIKKSATRKKNFIMTHFLNEYNNDTNSKMAFIGSVCCKLFPNTDFTF